MMTGIIHHQCTAQVTSNVATANITLPVLAELAVATGTNPLYLMLPATISCSYAFMLPVRIIYFVQPASSGLRENI